MTNDLRKKSKILFDYGDVDESKDGQGSYAERWRPSLIDAISCKHVFHCNFTKDANLNQFGAIRTINKTKSERNLVDERNKAKLADHTRIGETSKRFVYNRVRIHRQIMMMMMMSQHQQMMNNLEHFSLYKVAATV